MFKFERINMNSILSAMKIVPFLFIGSRFFRRKTLRATRLKLVQSLGLAKLISLVSFAGHWARRLPTFKNKKRGCL